MIYLYNIIKAIIEVYLVKMIKNINEQEIKKFSSMAYDWWNPNGKFSALHSINPIRIRFILDIVFENFGLNPLKEQSLKKIKILDIGCGGGLITEPMAKLGAQIEGIDADIDSIKIAKEHAKKEDLKIRYSNENLDILIEDNSRKFDVIFALEILEHVDYPDDFLSKIVSLSKKNGLVFISSINKNIKSLLLAKYIAEYVLNWVPRGTHDWNKFINPLDLEKMMLKNSFELISSKGIIFNPMTYAWKIGEDTSVNYITAFKKKSI